MVRVSHLLGAWVEINRWRLCVRQHASHLAWVCWLKCIVIKIINHMIMSHNECVRGLKFRHYTANKISTYVAPFVGAWVEMQQFLRETTSERSHPEWVCGLKLRDPHKIAVCLVAPCVGAWGEMQV